MTELEMLVTLLDDRGGELMLRDGAVVERATGRRLTPAEYTARVERACEEMAELEDEELESERPRAPWHWDQGAAEHRRDRL